MNLVLMSRYSVLQTKSNISKKGQVIALDSCYVVVFIREQANCFPMYSRILITDGNSMVLVS